MATITKNITKEELNILFVEHATDIYQNPDEIWIGLKGTTTLKAITQADEDHIFYIEYGVTVQELRKDPEFFAALFNNADVNHALLKDELSKSDLYEVFRWYNEFNLVLPCSPCGLCNFVDSYK